MAAMPSLVEIGGVRRSFGARLALDGVDLEVGPGEIVGLVGPNGSGKTTLLKIVAGFLRPDAGEVRVVGLEPFREQARIMERARFAFAPPALFESLSAREHLVHLAGIRANGTPPVSAAEIDGSLELVGLADRARDRVRTFSFGMRQRLVLAQALLPMPELLVLDEPTDGLDPLAVLELRDLLRRLRAEHGLAILLSSHLLIEIEELVDRMLVLTEGRTLFHGAPSEMLAGQERLRLGADDLGRAAEVLARHGLTATPRDGELDLEPGSLDARRAVEWLTAGGVELESFRVHRPSLEEALLARLREASGLVRGDGGDRSDGGDA